MKLIFEIALHILLYISCVSTQSNKGPNVTAQYTCMVAIKAVVKLTTAIRRFMHSGK